MNLFKLIQLELKAIGSNPVIVLTIFGGVLFYSVLYPLPYSNQTPREQTVTVVNLDNSQISRQLERMVDATPQVKLVSRSHSIEQAKQRFLNKEVQGIFVIPNHFYRDLVLGKAPVISYAGDASYFLVYGTIVEGLASATGTLAAEARVTRIMASGEPMPLAVKEQSVISGNLKPTFNPTVGYVDYVVPAVFILILQQTLVMGIGMLGGTQKYGLGYWSRSNAVKLVLARVLIFVAIYYFLSMYYMGFSFDYYRISRLADPNDLLLLLLPFLTASGFIGVALGALLPRRELVTVVVLISSMPLIFSAGFIWPVESLPTPVMLVSGLFPSTHAIQAFVKMNQMGAELTEIETHIKNMMLLVLLWGCIALLSYRKAISRHMPN